MRWFSHPVGGGGKSIVSSESSSRSAVDRKYKNTERIIWYGRKGENRDEKGGAVAWPRYFREGRKAVKVAGGDTFVRNPEGSTIKLHAEERECLWRYFLNEMYFILVRITVRGRGGGGVWDKSNLNIWWLIALGMMTSVIACGTAITWEAWYWIFWVSAKIVDMCK